jgi:putative transposase
MVENPKHFAKYERKIRVEHRSLCRKKKGSNSWKKQAKKLARLYHTIANVRKDFLHKTSTQIAKQYSTVYVEDLNIRNMSKNKCFSKHILDCGWGLFRTMLEYKTNVVKVDPKYTSQICSSCGEKDAKSRISQSEFVCTKCGVVSHADINAAKNILSRGAAMVR